MAAVLSQKDATFRTFSLSGNIRHVIGRVCIPLAFFQSFSHLFNILDSLMASHISATAVSAVAYMAQIQFVIAAVGQGLAAGSSLKISESYGAGNYQLVRTQLSSLVSLCAIFAGFTALLLPFTSPLLRILGTPDSFIDIGTKYFNIALLATLLGFFNNVYISIERARGNSKTILYLNTGVIILKLSLTALFIYGLHGGVTQIAVATLISQAFLFVFAVINLAKKNDVFSFSLSCVSFRKKIIAPMLHISLPVIAEKVSFQFGKSVINSMSSSYGELTVGALGISNNINGIATSTQAGFQDGGSAIISQNRGADQHRRTVESFKNLLLINTVIGGVYWIILNVCIGPITALFAHSAEGMNYEFQQMIIRVFRYDSFGSSVPLGITGACMALLFGYEKTKLTLIINFCRVFLFRIPVLWILQHCTGLGSESVGIMMAVSNILVTVHSCITVWFVLRKERRKRETPHTENR